MSMSSFALLLKALDRVNREPGFFSDDSRSMPLPGRFYDENLPLMNSIASSMCPYLQQARLNAENRIQQQQHQLTNIGKDGFQVCIDVASFRPNELTVKVIDDCVLIEGKHEERKDEFGHIKRHFVRRYKLPQGFEGEKVVSTLSSDGILTIMVPKPQIQNNANERIVQIQQTGPAHLCVKNNQEESQQQQSPSPPQQQQCDKQDGARGDKK